MRDATTEGTVPFGGGETWYRVTGDLSSELTPLVVLHGGPGATHQYVLSLTELASDGRPVIHYDQIGCGQSTRFPDRGGEFFTVQLFLDELDEVLRSLGIADRYHLLGQSWGGMLAAEHAITRPRGLRALVLSNSPAAMSLWSEGTLELRQQLPTDVRDTLIRHERDGTFDSAEYLAAQQVFYDRHVCRVVPAPEEVQRTFDALSADATVYNVMNGPNEFTCVGTLRDWTVVDRLQHIQAPTLNISGEFDEATPVAVRPFAERIPNSTWTVISGASHMPFVENPTDYFEVVSQFLRVHD